MKRKAIVKLAQQLQSLDNSQSLFHLLQTNEQQFNLLCINPPYNVFQVPKRNGEFRTIEDPGDVLQKIQAVLKKHLQALYSCYQTPAAFGYISRADDEQEVRGIYGNAMQHKNNDYLVNIDLEDFFHFIRWQLVYDSLSRPPFKIHESVARQICNISIFEGRLPMGAPTSPALSNIAAFTLDQEILNYCRQENLTYTRYVDDMSFSAMALIAERQFQQISSIIVSHGYELNMKKYKQFGPGETKKITGLEVKDTIIRVPDDFINEVKAEIENLKAWVLMQTRIRPSGSLEAQLIKPLQKIRGALNFIESVHGANHDALLALEQKLEQAMQPPADYESMNWLEIGYEIF